MANRSQTPPQTATWLAIGGVAVLAIAVIALSFLAYERAHPPVSSQPVAPVPTFGESAAAAPTPTASQSPTVTSTPSATDSPVDRGVERFFSVGSQAIWRAVAGTCGVSAPLVERSTDNGRTWTDVTPRYKQLAQLASLDAFTPTEGQLVGGIGAGCETQALRTFTEGQFWDSYSDVLAASSYVDLWDASEIHTPTGLVAAPCAAATGLRSSGTRLAVICDGEAYTFDASGSWQSTTIDGAVALAFTEDGLVVGHSSASCPGLAVSFVDDANSPTDVGCSTEVDPMAGAIAMAADGSRMLVWAGDSVVGIAG